MVITFENTLLRSKWHLLYHLRACFWVNCKYTWCWKRSLGFYASRLNRQDIFIGERQVLSSDTIGLKERHFFLQNFLKVDLRGSLSAKFLICGIRGSALWRCGIQQINKSSGIPRECVIPFCGIAIPNYDNSHENLV